MCPVDNIPFVVESQLQVLSLCKALKWKHLWSLWQWCLKCTPTTVFENKLRFFGSLFSISVEVKVQWGEAWHPTPTPTPWVSLSMWLFLSLAVLWKIRIMRITTRERVTVRMQWDNSWTWPGVRRAWWGSCVTLAFQHTVHLVGVTCVPVTSAAAIVKAEGCVLSSASSQ